MGLEGKDLKSLMDMIQSKVGNGAEVQMFAVSGDEMEEVTSMEDLQRLIHEKSGCPGCGHSHATNNRDAEDYGRQSGIAEGMAHVLEEHKASVGDFLHSSVALLSSRMHDEFQAKTGGDEEAYSKYLQGISASIAIAMMKGPKDKVHSAFDVAIALMMVGMQLVDIEEQFSVKTEEPVMSQKDADRKAFIEDFKKALDGLM